MLIDEGFLTPISGKGNRINKIPSGKENTALQALIKEIQYQGYKLEDIKNEVDKLIKEKEEKRIWLEFLV